MIRLLVTMKTKTQTRKQTTYKERDEDDTKGKIKYRLRKQLEQEATKEVKEYENPKAICTNDNNS